MGGEAKRRKLKYGALYGTPQCPGAGMTEKLREEFPGRSMTLGKFMRTNENPVNRKKVSERFEKRHGFKREFDDSPTVAEDTYDGGSRGFED